MIQGVVGAVGDCCWISTNGGLLCSDCEAATTLMAETPCRDSGSRDQICEAPDHPETDLLELVEVPLPTFDLKLFKWAEK